MSDDIKVSLVVRLRPTSGVDLRGVLTCLVGARICDVYEVQIWWKFSFHHCIFIFAGCGHTHWIACSSSPATASTIRSSTEESDWLVNGVKV
jgi:hypothetical protein